MAEFKGRMDGMIERLKNSDPAEDFDEVLMPGEPELRQEAERLRTGIPLSGKVLASLQAEAEDLGVPMPTPSSTPIAEGA